MTENKKISIVIPVYNAEKYISRCIDSIISQTYNNWELILINDGSHDSSGTVCNEYAANDNRIKAIHRPNGGASSARNAGIEAATGEYLCFVDADDYVSPTMLADFLSAPESDIVISSVEIISGEKSHEMIVKPFSGNIDEFFRNIRNLNPHLLGSPCNKLYNRDLVNRWHIHFPADVDDTNEDQLFNWQLYLKAGSISGISAVTYHYVHIQGSLSHNNSYRHGEAYSRRQLRSMSRLYGLFDTIASAENRANCQRIYHSIAFHGIIRAIYVNTVDNITRKEILSAYKRMLRDTHYSFWNATPGFLKKLRSVSTRLPLEMAHYSLMALYGIKKLLPKR